jgi:O-antigen biosynthesis protein
MGSQNPRDESSTSLTPVLAIVAPVRKEARYLIEWLAYHRALGISTFLLADNGGNDTTSALLQELDRDRLVKRFDWRGQTRFQLEFYSQAIHVARSFADGLFFIKVDEFLRPEDQLSISDVARTWLADPTVGGVALNWAIYGSSGRQQYDSELVIERFTRRAHQEFSGNKQRQALRMGRLLRGPRRKSPRRYTGLRTIRRYPRGRLTWDTSQGRPPLGITTKVIWDMLRVEHFILKSREEFAANAPAADCLQ